VIDPSAFECDADRNFWSHSMKRVYSPTQAAMGAFLGGPLASIILLRYNYRALGNTAGENAVLRYGVVALIALLCVLPFLPDKFPNMLIPLATIIATRSLVEKHQFTKQAIQASDEFSFQSNWRVFWIGIASLIAFCLIGIAWMIALDRIGIAKIA
jgi:hypothetical protein